MRSLLAVFRTVAGNRGLARVSVAYAFFIVSEYSVWIAMLVYAYQQGGATTAGLVALAQLAPAAALAPFAAVLADRSAPVRLLVGGYLVQALAMAGTATAVHAGASPYLAYGCAVVSATAVVTTRPAQAPLVPALSRRAEELTATNVTMGWLESIGIVLAGAGTGALLAVAGVASVFAVGAGLVLVALVLVASLRTSAIGAGDRAGAVRAVGSGLRLLARSPQPRLLVALLTAEWMVIGALDVLFVVLALDVLDVGESWVGWLNTAFGLGGVLAGALTAGLIGRKLGRPIIYAGLAFSVALAATAFVPGAAAAAVALSLAGAGRAVFDVATRTLLQRAVPSDVLGRVFGVVEGLTMAGLAAGSLLVPLLVELGGSRAALLGAALLLPVVAALGGRALLGLDAAASVPVVEIALLRSVRLFADLPAPALEGLAGSLVQVELAAGDVLIREGEPGDRYYVIASGAVDVSQRGQHLRQLSRGDGLGEIALLRDVPRTATVRAVEPTTLYAVERQPFLATVSRHPQTSGAAQAIVGERLHDHPEPDPS